MRIFISYAHVDQYLVQQIVDILREGSHDPWFDHRLLPGQDWKATLLQAIDECDAFLYALTPESVASEWCQWEFAKAVAMGKPIIPVMLQAKTDEHPDFPPLLKRYQWADFSEGPTPGATAKLMGGLMQVLVTIPREDAPAAPAAPRDTPAQAASPSGRSDKIAISQSVTGSTDVTQIGVLHGDLTIGEQAGERKPPKTAKQGHIYVSYSHADKAYVADLVTDMRARGIPVWIDEEVPFGQDWEEAAAQAMQDCAAFVVVMSETAAQSRNVAKEVEAAARLSKPIFPLWLSGTPFPALERRRAPDVRSGEMPPREFYEALKTATDS